ncbi:recombinase family protein [Actinomadura harenae]|nr:recombinase family protein [Actinomadura harenae]
MPPQLAALPVEPIPAIGYVRVSMLREEMISPELQRAAITEWARRNGREVTEWIEDLDKTGRNFKRKVQRAVAGVRDGRAREIIVWKFSRFGRQRLGWAVHLDLVESAGGDLISATEEVDARTASGRFARGMLAEVAAFESDRASEQWMEALDYRVKRGLPGNGTRRWGYIRRGRIPHPTEPHLYIADPSDPLGERYEPDPDFEEPYASLYEQYVAGINDRRLAKWLNDHELYAPDGGLWTGRQVLRILDSGFAAGYLREHSKECRCKQRGRCTNVVYRKGTHRPVIGEDLWQAYLERRAANRRPGQGSKEPKYPLSGLMRDPGCKAVLTAQHGGAPYGAGYAFRCNAYGESAQCQRPWVRRTVAEERVLGQLAEWAAEIDALALQLEPQIVPEPKTSAKNDVASLKTQIAKLDRALVKLTTMRAMDDDESPEAEAEFRRSRDELRSRRRKREEKLQAAEAVQEPPPSKADFGPVIQGLLAEWDVLTVDEKQRLLRSLIRVIWVHRTGHGRGSLPRLEIVPVWAPAS